ncbi:MAG: hypothetical protein R3E39_29420 [Anaerolineae bacterium]
MMRRVVGLLLMIRALAPLLVILILAVGVAIIYRDVQAAVETPVTNIKTAFNELGTSIQSVEGDLETVGNNVTTVINQLSQFNPLSLIPDIPDNITLPSLTIPDISVSVPTVDVKFSDITILGVTLTYPSGLTIGTKTLSVTVPDLSNLSLPLPGLGQLDDAIRSGLSGITDVFSVFDDAFDSINKLTTTLRTLPDNFSTITTQTQSLVEGLRGVVLSWGSTLTLVLVLLFVLALIYVFVPSLDDFWRGWRMLRGLPA